MVEVRAQGRRSARADGSLIVFPDKSLIERLDAGRGEVPAGSNKMSKAANGCDIGF